MVLLPTFSMNINLNVDNILRIDPMGPRWWFQIFFMFTPTWGNDPI